MPNKFINNSNIRNGGSPIRYTYNYDTIGRLIGTDQTGGTAELRASYQYDTNNRLTRMSYSIPGVVDNATESFYYNGDGNSVVEDRTNVGEGTLKGMALFSNSWITYSYDDLSRLTQRRVGNILDEHYTYLAGSETGTTTTLPETYYTTLKGSSTKQSGYRYTYDVRNNITRITNLKDNSYIAYACDKLGQMQYATEYAANGTAQKRYKYYYDNAGNLTSWRIEDGTATIIKEEHTYTYGDSNWKDLLTAFDGQSITYDANGNPTKYYNGGTMTWRNGRQLASYSLGGTTYSYEYDVNGLRTRKTNADGGYTEYYIIDGLPVAEQRHYDSGAEWYTMRYLYDESNNPVGFGMQYPTETKWENYYFAKNVQGDIVAIYRYDYNASTQKPYGTLIATYQYDPWGKPQGIKDASGKAIAQTANHVATYNPFRYRGYRYDGDTGLYYLQSRYYDPMTCRFVNADKYASTGQGQLGHNMYAYCNNNAIRYDDQTGERMSGPGYSLVNDGGSTTRIIGTSDPKAAEAAAFNLDNNIPDKENLIGATSTARQIDDYNNNNIINRIADKKIKEAAVSQLMTWVAGILTIEGEIVSTFALNGFGVVIGGALLVKEEHDLLPGCYNQYQVMTAATYLKQTEISGVYAKFTVITKTNYVDYVIGKNQEWRIVGETYSISDYKLINMGG